MDDFWTALGLAIGLILVLEGALYALFPAAMRRLIAAAVSQPDSALRAGGLVAAIAGVVLVWAIRTF